MEKQLKSKRRDYKTKLTKFKSVITNFENGKITISELKLRLQVVETLLDKFEEVQLELENLESAIEETEAAERDNFEDNYYEVVAKAHDLVKQEEQSTVDVQQHNTFSSKIKLPELTLPKFDGDFTQWLMFKDTFSSAIHNNNNLHNVDKFRYLKGTLQGNALQLVNSLDTTSENYNIAWNLLVDRYENERIIIHNHMKAIFELPTIQRDSHVSLRQAIDSFQRHMRALKALNEPVDTWDTMLIYVLSSKLDSQTRKLWETEVGDKIGKRKPQFKELIDFLANKTQILEITDKFTKIEHKQSIPRKMAFVTTNKLACFICKEDHCIYQCPKLLRLPIRQRQEKLKEVKICINCLKPNHSVRECRSPTNCQKCNKRHNTLLHFEESDQNMISDLSSEPVEQAAVTNCFTRQMEYDVLLPTAMIRVYNKEGKEFVARALLDSGSQTSFITSKFRKKLDLVYKKVNIPVYGINRVNTAITSKSKIKFKSNYNNFTGTLDCLILDKITDHLPRFLIDKTRLRIPNLKLSDPEFNLPKEIDILIGADMFWQLLCVGQINLGESMPTLQKTHLGWIISGPICGSNEKEEGMLSYNSGIKTLKHQLQEITNAIEANQNSLQSWMETIEAISKETREQRPPALVPIIQSDGFISKENNLSNKIEGDLLKVNSLESKMSKLHDDNNKTGQIHKKLANNLDQVNRKLKNNEQLLDKYEAHLSGLDYPVLTANIQKSITDKPDLQPSVLSGLETQRTQIEQLLSDLKSVETKINKLSELKDIPQAQNSTLKTMTYGKSSAPFLAERTFQQWTKQRSTCWRSLRSDGQVNERTPVKNHTRIGINI